MLALTKEQIRELYKERDEALFFDYKPIKAKKIFIKPNKVMLDKPAEVFNHFINVRSFISNYNGIQKNAKAKSLSWVKSSSKQVVIKTLSNLDEFGAKNALSYVIRNSNDDFAITQDGEKKSLKEIMDDWNKDFTHKKNAKEVLHLAFCIDEKDENFNDRRLKNAVDMVMQKNFYLYKYAMVIHTHQNKLHAHILLNKNNLFDGQKFHLSRAEFKPFFNQLRNDFALALKTQGLEYHNHYKIENDLSRIQSEIKQDNFTSKINVLDELTQLELSIVKKIKSKEKKIETLLNDLDKMSEKAKEIRGVMKGLKAKMDFNSERGLFEKSLGDRYLDLLDELKELTADKRRKIDEMKIIKKEVKKLQSDFNKFDLQKYNLRHEQEQEFSNLLQKKKYLEFITTNLDRQTLTKSEINLKIRAIQNEISMSENSANEMLKNRIKNSILTSSILGKKNNAFILTRAYKDLETNLAMLKECGAKMQDEVWQSDDDREQASSYFKNYQERLESNKAIVLELINQRFAYLKQELERKKQSNRLKYYEVKEYDKISKFLNKGNDIEIQALYEFVDDKKGGGTGQTRTQTQSGGKAQEQEIKQETRTQGTQEQTQQTQSPVNETNKTKETAQNKQTQSTKKENLNQQMKQSGFTIKR